MTVMDSLRTLYHMLRWTSLKGFYEHGVPGVRWSGKDAGRESRRRAQDRKEGS